MEFKKQYNYPTQVISKGDKVRVTVEVVNELNGKHDVIKTEELPLDTSKWNSVKEYLADEAHGLEGAYVLVVGHNTDHGKKNIAKLG